MDRRDFLRLASLAAIGGIFVPKYERWFRANRILVPAEPDLVLMDHYVKFDGAADWFASIEASEDGATWRAISRQPYNPGLQRVRLTMPHTTARYVRLNVGAPDPACRITRTFDFIGQHDNAA